MFLTDNNLNYSSFFPSKYDFRLETIFVPLCRTLLLVTIKYLLWTWQWCDRFLEPRLHKKTTTREVVQLELDKWVNFCPRQLEAVLISSIFVRECVYRFRNFIHEFDESFYISLEWKRQRWKDWTIFRGKEYSFVS